MSLYCCIATTAAAAVIIVFNFVVAVLCAWSILVSCRYQPNNLHDNINGQNLVSFQRIELKLDTVFIIIEPIAIHLGHCIVPLSSNGLKKSVCVWK